MKIGVMSDTHGHLDMMRRAATKMTDDHRVEVIIHLGDDSTDAEQLASLSIDLWWVPGIFEDRYQDLSISNRVIREFGGISFLLSHTATADSHDLPTDIDPAQAISDGEIKVLLHGHSHLWRIGDEKGVIIVNPGHLKPDDKRGGEPSFAILDLLPGRLDVKILSMEDRILAEKTFFIEK